MTTAAELTFLPYLLATDNAVNAAGPLTAPAKIRDKRNNLIRAEIGEYVIQDEDGNLRVMSGAEFEAEYAAVGTITAPSNLARAGGTTTTIDVSWTVGDADAHGHIEKAGVEIAINDPNDGTYTVTGLSPNTGYAIRVRNKKNEKFSAYVGPSTLYTLPADITAAPTSPAKSATTVDLAWDNTDPTCKTQVWQDDGAGGAFTKIATVAAGTETYQATGLTTATEYKFKLKQEGAASALASANYSGVLTITTD